MVSTMACDSTSSSLVALISSLLRVTALNRCLSDTTSFQVSLRRPCRLLLWHIWWHSPTTQMLIECSTLPTIDVTIRRDHKLFIISKVDLSVQSWQVNFHLKLRSSNLVLFGLFWGEAAWLVTVLLAADSSRSLSKLSCSLILAGMLGDVRSPTAFLCEVIMHSLPCFVSAASTNTSFPANFSFTELLPLINWLEGIILQHDATFQQLFTNVRVVQLIVVCEAELVLQVHDLALQRFQLRLHDWRLWFLSWGSIRLHVGKCCHL